MIDEIQPRPDFFPLLRVLADRNPLPARFLILGSASPNLLRQSSESLAGLISTLSMSGFSLEEVGAQAQNALWRRGGFPLSFTASSEGTARRYVDLLHDLFMVRLLQPWYANLGKRQVKSPKVYIRDTGLLHILLGIRTEQELLLHPRSGASWEGFVIEEMIKATAPEEVYFWGTHSGTELDLLMIKDGKKIGVECKRVDAPRLSPSMRTVMQELELTALLVVYPGSKRYPLAEDIWTVPLSSLAEERKAW